MQTNSAQRLMLTIQAAQARYFREANAERNLMFMKHKAQQGIWCFGVPFGYQYSSFKNRREVIHKSPEASIVRDMFEGVANKSLMTRRAVLNHFNKKREEVGLSAVTMDKAIGLLKNAKYTGVFAFPKWGIATQRWTNINPIIDQRLFHKVQTRLATI